MVCIGMTSALPGSRSTDALTSHRMPKLSQSTDETTRLKKNKEQENDLEAALLGSVTRLEKHTNGKGTTSAFSWP